MTRSASRISGFVSFAVLLLAFMLAFVAPPVEAFADSAYCPVCGKTTEGMFEYDENDGFYEPTCTSAGNPLYYCYECESFNEVTIPALGHAYVQVAHTNPTCTAAGSTTQTCSRCGDTQTTTVAALGHSAGSPATEHAIEATCTSAGSYDSVTYCTRCSAELSRTTTTLDALGHDYELTTTPPTCETAGADTYTCTRCGDTYANEIPALGHIFEDGGTVEATCTTPGSKTSVCSRCGAEVTEEYPALGHIWPETWIVGKEPTVEEEGLEYRECTRCGEREERPLAKLPPEPTFIETTTGKVVIFGGGGVLLVGILIFVLRKILAAKGAASAAKAVRKFKAFKLTEQAVFAAVSATPEDDSFLALLKSRPNVALTMYDGTSEATLDEQIEAADPDLLLVDVTSVSDLDSRTQQIGEFKTQFEEVKYGIIANAEDPAVAARLASLKADGAILNWAYADDNKFVKLSRFIIPLYKDAMKDADTMDAIGTIAEMFGIPVVPEVVGAVGTAERVRDLHETAKDAADGTDMEAADAFSVINSIGELLGLDLVALAAELAEDASDTKDTLTSKEEGEAHGVYKTGEVAKDIGDMIGTILG